MFFLGSDSIFSFAYRTSKLARKTVRMNSENIMIYQPALGVAHSESDSPQLQPEGPNNATQRQHFQPDALREVSEARRRRPQGNFFVGAENFFGQVFQ